MVGTRIGRLRVIFKLPKTLDTSLGPRPRPPSWPQGPLAYIEWYSKTPSSAQEHLGNMYSIKKGVTTALNHLPGAVMPLHDIRQSCMLIPKFTSGDIPANWNTSNVLDLCSSFLVNNWSSKYAYQTIW